MNTKKKSAVWKYFTKKDEISASCNICTKVLKHGGNTTNLIQHLQRKHTLHLQSNASLDQENLDKTKNKQESNSNILKNRDENEICIDDPDDPGSYGGTTACNITNSIAYMIAKDNFPLSTVENEGFQLLMKTIAPLYKVPCRKTLTKLLDSKYEVLKRKFIDNIQHSSITVTCDIWTDISNKSYLGITIHYLKTETLFVKGTIGVIPLETNHTSEYIKNELLLAFKSFNIDLSNIVAVVTDSAPNIVNAVNSLFNVKKHIPCMAHVLAHLVPDSLKTIHLIETIITKVKNTVTFVKRSVVASDELIRLQKRDGKTEGTIVKFKQDVPTRWNSTFYMIERFLMLREYIYPIILKSPIYVEMITHEEFDILHDMVKLLRPIELATKEIGGDLYPTCSIIIPIIRCMTKAIHDYISTTKEGIILKKNILSESERRFHKIEQNRILAVSTILDPRFKKIHFQQPMAVSSAVTYINNLIQVPTDEIESVNANALISSNDCKEHEGLWAFHDNLVISSTVTHDNPGGINVELRQHLNQPVIARYHNPLQYWQTLKPAYPTLFNIAKKYLAIVATSVPSERLFSKAGIIKSEARNRLTPKRLNILLFLQSLTREDWNIS
ncbi:PREDICTED: zinc finger BED domain-containing protein 4-like [Vollenhovia emeryi]|uniref:zinc finger BED domain-containing protein 4-like n=1 Tax=Vollenhovia emeryi TaxID=411798 RepID=UPI0005F4C714|nr:PREDICTED: zinc finger BED domain-containing protein 4-like [Vollenhovia emeryi]